MTRQMADDGKPSLYEAIAVFDKSASRTTPNAQTEAWTVIRAAVAALQAERDALRADVETYQTNITEESSARFDAEHALEALRGQVAGLVAALSELADAGEDAWGAERPCVRAARAELLAIKERMG